VRNIRRLCGSRQTSDGIDVMNYTVLVICAVCVLPVWRLKY
jgi:hypothetical protein